MDMLEMSYQKINFFRTGARVPGTPAPRLHFPIRLLSKERSDTLFDNFAENPPKTSKIQVPDTIAL